MSEILVTGGAGFIGSHLTDNLLIAGHEVTTIDDLSRGNPDNLNPEANNITGDIRDSELIDEQVAKNDIVYHLAGLARVRPSIEQPVLYHEVNVNGTLNILEACRKYGKKIIFASSSSVFGNSPAPFHENTKFDPQNPYALQKLMGEMYIRLYNQLYDTRYAILRYFNVYGSRQILGGEYSTVIGTFLDQRKNNKPLSIFGDGKQRRDFTHISDVVTANIEAMKYIGEYNIGRGNNRSVNEIAEMVGGKIVRSPAPKGEARVTLCDNTKAREQMGWEPRIDVTKEIIEEMDAATNQLG